VPNSWTSLLNQWKEKPSYSEGADKATLVGWCRSFGLQVSGNKATLKDRLHTFSANQDQWNS